MPYRPQLHIHVLGQPTAGQQQPFARAVIHVLVDIPVHADAFAGVQQFQQETQPRIGAVDARQGQALPGCAVGAGPRLAIGGVALADVLQAGLQGDGARAATGLQRNEGVFQRAGQVIGQARGGLAQGGEQVWVGGSGHGGVLVQAARGHPA